MPSNPHTIIAIEAIRERDTDILLLEELLSNKNFTDWFLKEKVKLKKKYEIKGAWHSITQTGLGENDVVFRIKSGKEVIQFLFENKVDSGFMPEQAKRYRKRGEHYVESGDCTSCYPVLFAPRSYIQDNKDFDLYLEYEELRDWFKNKSKLGERGEFKAEVLSIAIERLRRGYSPIINENATRFRWDYYNYVKENYPYLNMLRPQERMPKRTGFVRFRPDGIGLLKGEFVIHKLRGVVDLQLSRDIEQFEPLIKTGMEIVKTGKSHSIRIKTKEINVESDFRKQLPEIEDAVKKIILFYKWANKNLKQRRVIKRR